MKKRLLSERGTSLVETALVFPVILILFLGTVEVGFLLFSHVQVANATREGARTASLCRMKWQCNDLTDVVKTTVFSEPRFLNMTDADSGGNTTVVVQTDPSFSVPPAVGEPFTVTVTYNHSSPFVSNYVPMFPAEIPVQHTLVMRFDK
jgi:Flp pilus assembly protein TadG